MSKDLFRHRPSMRQARQAGFTILEVLVAFGILMVILAGMTTALTSAMRLNKTQRERALAQDIVRDVVAKYVKTIPFDATDSTTSDLTPFDESGVYMDSTTFAQGHTRTLFDATVSPQVENLTTPVPLSYMKVDLEALTGAKLDVITYPIKRAACTTACTSSHFFSTKLNVVVRLTWDNSGSNARTLEVPTVVGEADVTRASREEFKLPTVPTVTGPACTTLGLAPVSGSSCCTGLNLISGVCSSAICTPPGQNRSLFLNLACCSGSTDNGSGLCVANPTCTAATFNKSTTGGLECCTGSTDDGTGLCVANPTCTPAGQARSAFGNTPCCSGSTETAGTCVAACTPVGSSPPSGGSCCAGLKLNTLTNLCITCISAGSTPPAGNATLCCSGQVNGSGKCKN